MSINMRIVVLMILIQGGLAYGQERLIRNDRGAISAIIRYEKRNGQERYTLFNQETGNKIEFTHYYAGKDKGVYKRTESGPGDRREFLAIKKQFEDAEEAR